MRSNETTVLAVVAGKRGGHSYWGLNSKSETIKKQQHFGPYTHQQYSFGVFQKESIQACQNIKGASYIRSCLRQVQTCQKNKQTGFFHNAHS